MFLFRGTSDTSTNARGNSASVSSSADRSNSKPQHREFLAFKAARFLGGAARHVGASLARLTAGPTASALRTELESRVSGQRGEAEVGAAITEWARLLAATDDTPRYEAADGGPPLNFRTAFLCSRSFELALAVVGCNNFAQVTATKSGGAGGARPGAAATAAAGAPSFLDNPERATAWRAFLRGAVLPGGEDAAAELPEIFALTRHFPDCRRWVDEVAASVKGDAKTEELRAARIAAGARAEELRASVRQMQAEFSGGSGGLAGASSAVWSQGVAISASSREAVAHYAAFREGLEESVVRLRDSVLATRLQRLGSAREALGVLGAEAERRGAEAAARREEVLQLRDDAVAEPRRAIELLENDEGRFQVDERGVQLDEMRRQLMIQLEETSQSLAARRDERLALLQRRDDAVAEHRWRTENVEKQLRDLRPALFHKAVGSRCTHMTEGEILSGLTSAVKASRDVVASARAPACASSQRRFEELEAQRVALEKNAGAALRDHARLQLSRLEAASATVRATTAALLDGARSRATSAAMGLRPEEESMPSRRDIRRLQKALKAAETAWAEIDTFWGSTVATGARSAKEGTSSASCDWLASVVAETRPSATSALDAARGRMARCLEHLRQLDPAIYELVVCVSAEDDGATEEALISPSGVGVATHWGRQEGGDGREANAEGGDGEETTVPHGWEVHATADGHLYYHSLVTGQTQWEAPEEDAAVSAGWRLFQADDGNWFYHNSYDGASLWYPDLPDYAAEPARLDKLSAEANIG